MSTRVDPHDEKRPHIMTSTTTLTKSNISILLCKERCGRAKSRYDKQNDKASKSVGGGELW